MGKLWNYSTDKGKDYTVFCLNHDFHKIYKINMIFFYHLDNLVNLMKTMVQDKLNYFSRRRLYPTNVPILQLNFNPIIKFTFYFHFCAFV